MLNKENKILQWFVIGYSIVVIGLLTILILHGFKVL